MCDDFCLMCGDLGEGGDWALWGGCDVSDGVDVLVGGDL